MFLSVIPAKAGTQRDSEQGRFLIGDWVPAFAGMTAKVYA